MKAILFCAEILFLLLNLSSGGSPPGDVVGKITVGYQGWFATPTDGSPMSAPAWWHWAQDQFETPTPSNIAIKAWPYMPYYHRTYQTGFANLGNGNPATLYSNYDNQTVDTHVRWMAENNLDTLALQRFDPFSDFEGPIRDAITATVRVKSEKYDRKFYIMYDVSGWTNMSSQIIEDWDQKMSLYTSSSAYAHQNGMPVVGIWGFGFNDSMHPFSAQKCLDVINQFKTRDLYVIGGVPTQWRSGNSDSRPGFFDVYTAFDMISPWMVGRIGQPSESDNYYETVNIPDMALINELNLDYQPCVLPGDLSVQQRIHGDFMWRQFYNMIRVGAQGLYISMFDEYNEGNQIAMTAPDASWLPQGANFSATDEDGVWCLPDYYMRLTGDGGRMLKGEIALTDVRPTLTS